MKTIKYLLLLLWVACMASCQQVEVPINEQYSYVNFYDSLNQYRRCIQAKSLNFYYADKSVTRDTVWFDIISFANISKQDYQVKVSQRKISSNVILDMKDAEPGVQYVSFDDPAVQGLMILHKGALLDSVGIVVLRDRSLQEEGRRIVMRIVDSDEVKAADQRADTDIDVAYVALYIADCLTQPTNWDMWFFLGAYGAVKHDFIVRHSNAHWDAEFISGLDSNTNTYYLYKFRNELAEENAERVANGLGVLTEKDGTPVEFPQNYY